MSANSYVVVIHHEAADGHVRRQFFVWQASRNSGPKPRRSAITRSLALRSAQADRPSTTITRHVEHDAWPPQAWENELAGERGGQDRLREATLDEPLIRQDVDVRHGWSALLPRAYGPLEHPVPVRASERQ